MNKPLFIAILEDENLYQGGDYNKTRWLELPNDKKIKRLFYTLPDGNHLVFDMYDKYFLMIEKTFDLSGNNAGKPNLEYSYVLCQKEGVVICYKINLQYRSNKKIGDIERTECKIDDLFVKSLNKNGWR